MKTRNSLHPPWFVALFVIISAIFSPVVHAQQSGKCYDLVDRVAQVRVLNVELTYDPFNDRLVERKYELKSAGSASLIEADSQYYYFLINTHVLDGYRTASPTQGAAPDSVHRSINVIFHNEISDSLTESTVRHALNADVLGYASSNILDIALLRVPKHVNLTAIDPLERGDVNSLQEGDAVYQIGNAHDIPFSLSVNTVARSNFVFDRMALTSSRIFLQHVIGPGQSGGAVFDDRCKFIGLSQGYIPEQKLEYGIEEFIPSGFSLLIPIDYIEQILPKLLNGEVVRNTHLPIYTRPTYELPPEVYLGLIEHEVPLGIYIEEFVEGYSPCINDTGNNCLRIRDVITEFNEIRVKHFANIIHSLIFDHSPGDEVKIIVYRLNKDGKYERKELTIRLPAFR